MSREPGGLFTTVVFNPALLSKQDLVRGFIARQELLERLLDDLRRQQSGTVPQHQILIGQRGLGKTTLLRRLAFAIEDDAALSALWIPLVFPEEQYNVKNLGDFWLNCADALSDTLDRTGNKAAAEALDRKVECAPADPKRRAESALAILVDEAKRLGRGLVLLVDNIDIVLDRLDQEEEWAFRRVVSIEQGLYIVGASSRALEAFYEHGRAFYDYFQVHDLKGLSEAETFAMLERLAQDAGDERVQRILREKPERVRALRVLTGGNPRTLMLLYRVLSQGPEGDAERDLEQLLDLYTPLYKARFEELAPQSQQVVDALAIHWDPITAGELAQKLAPLSVNQVSAQLNRLEEYGVVEKTPWFGDGAGTGDKKTAFQIAERFFNIWYLMRASRRVRRRLIWLVKFLETWFERAELGERARKYLVQDPSKIGPERFAEMAFAYSQVVEDHNLRRNLETAGLKAALHDSVSTQFDFSDLPKEVLSRKERMERMRDLGARVKAMHFEGVDSEEFWRLLGGCPNLGMQEKMELVDRLPNLAQANLGNLCESLKSFEERVEQVFGDSLAISRLYDALSSGEIADVYDVDGTVAIADALGRELLPALAIYCRMGDDDEIDAAVSALRTLAAAPGCLLQAAVFISVLLLKPSGEFAKAHTRLRKHLPIAIALMTQTHAMFPASETVAFHLVGLHAICGDWEQAEALLRDLVASDAQRPDIPVFRAIVANDHLSAAIALLEKTGADERWRPLYEALRAIQAGSVSYLRRVAPEVRSAAQAILDEISPDLPKTKVVDRKRRKTT